MITLICKNCEKQYFVKPYRKNTSKFCSYKCHWEKQKGKKLTGKHKEKIGLSLLKHGLSKTGEYHAYYTKKWREKNPDKRKTYRNEYLKSHREFIYFLNRQRYYKRKNAKGFHTFEEWETLKKEYNYCCAMCGMQEPFTDQYFQYLTEDHIIPLTKNGTNYIDNIQPLCHRCNSIKSNKLLRK